MTNCWTANNSETNTDNNHQWLDQNGWEHRYVYLQTRNGKIYSATLNIANARDGRKILYDINKIKEVDDGDVPSDAKSRRGSHITSTSDSTVPQKASGVNTQSMQKSEKNTTAESSGEKSTGIRFSKSVQEYPYDMQTVIHEYLTSVDERLKSFCEQAVRNEVTDSARFYFDKVDAMTAKQIESITGIDVSGFKMTIESKQIKHINKRHGINGASDHSMSDMNDIARINYILHNYDNITYGGHSRSYKTPKGNGKNKNADTVLYSKKINGTYYLVQAIPDSKQRTLYIVTAYINKKGTSQFIDAKSPYETSKNETVSVPDTNIAQGEHGVNTKSMQNNARKSLNVEFDENTDFSENMKKVANMKSVCDLTGNEFAKGDTDLITQVTEYFTKIGNKVDSKYGSVVINRTGVKSSVSHGIGRKKAIAFKAVPSVIENGEIINYKSNYKNRGYDTAVITAPIKINNTPYFMATVIVVEKEKNSFYLHEVALQKKEDVTPFKTGTVNNGTPSGATSSIYSLLNSLQNVKKSSENNEIRLSKTVEPAKYTYEYFANKPDMQVTEIDDSKVYAASSQTRKDIIDRSVENAKRVGRVNAQGNAVIHVDDIDTDVIVSKNGIKHGLDRRLNRMAQVTMNIGSILQNSIRINETLPSKKDASGSYVLVGTAKNKTGDLFIVESVINSYTNELNSVNILYSINTKKEPTGLIDPELSSQSDVSLTGSTISISELLDYVNKYYPDILPEDVLKYYGHQSRPEGMLGKSALYSRAVDAAEYNSLLKENKQLKQMNSILQQELKPGHHISNSQALKLAHWLKKQRNSKMDAAKLGLQLRNLFDYIGNDENVIMDTVMEMATNIAKSVIDESQTKVLLDDYAQTVLQDIRQYKIKLSDAQKAEARHQYGNLHAFNRHLMGRVRVGEDGMSLDQAWQELAELHPGIFDTGMPEADQGIALAQTLDMLKESYVDNGMNYEDSAVALAYEIFDRYFEIPEYKTYAQRQNDKYDQLQGKYRKALHDVKTEYKDRYERRLREVKASAKAKQQQQRNAYMNWKQKHAAGAATIQDKNLYQQYKAILGAHSPKSLDEFLKIKYNNGDEWERLKYQYRTVNCYEVDGDVSAENIIQLDNAAYYTKKTGFDYSSLTGSDRRKIKQLSSVGNAAVMKFDNSIYFSHSRVGTSDTLEYSSYKGNYSLVGLSTNRQFKIKNSGDGILREYDTEAKFLEFVATKKQATDKFTVTILSEKHICESCQDVVKQFKQMFPNATVNIVSGKRGYNGSEEGLKTWKYRKKVK